MGRDTDEVVGVYGSPLPALFALVLAVCVSEMALSLHQKKVNLEEKKVSLEYWLSTSTWVIVLFSARQRNGTPRRW